MTRIYVPATAASVAQWQAEKLITAAALAESFEAPDDTEEGEYAALMSAADASAAMLAGPGRRFVVVVEPTAVSDSLGPADWSDVVAIHADPGERPADADPDEDLGWYTPRELADLLG